MKTKIYILATLCIAFLSIVSCSDDFIDVPSNDENSDNFFNSEEDYNKALIGAYDLLQATFWNVMVGEIASDNTLAGGDPDNFDGPSIQEIDAMEHDNVNEQLTDIWRWMYAGLNRANYILEFKDKTDFTGKDNVIGQALFLRAYYTFELTKWFGAIPLAIDKTGSENRILSKRIQFGDQFSINRVASISAAYELIEADLKEAIPYLNAVQDQKYKITKGAAQALLGKVYLYHGTTDNTKFELAATVLEDVISSGKYNLVSNYADIFEHAGENGIESIFEVQYTDVQGASFDCLQCSAGNVAIGFSGVREYVGPTYDSGYGFNTPTLETANAFEAGDTRKDATILQASSVASSFQLSRGETGLYNKKYIPRKGDLGLGDNNLTNPNNYRAIRYADVLLMAAEANNRKTTANSSKAQNYLNLVRERAFGDTAHNISSTGNTLTEAIWKERRVELVGEGHRFFDLVRTGKAATTIPGFKANKNEIFPIPLTELELANAVSRWGQNLGY